MGGVLSCLEGDYKASDEYYQVAPLKRGYPQDEVNEVHAQSNAAQFDQQQIGQAPQYTQQRVPQDLPPLTQPSAPDFGFGQPPKTILEEEVAGPQVAAEAHLPQAPRNWSCGELIGAGAFGRVYLGLNNDNGELVAVKQVTISKEEAVAGRVAQHVRELEKEVNVLKLLDHPNIVRYLGTDRTKDCLNIFLEYVPGGSISSLLAKFGSFKETVIKIYARQILLGLQYLHANKIVHRDIKGANILVDKAGHIKLADFGASKKIEDLVTIDSGVKSIKGTSYWMAPEVIKQTGHGRMADIWSFGCTLIEMYTGKPPWSQFSSQVSAMFHIASSKGPPPIPEHLSAKAKDFLLLCFDRVPSNRPNATRLLQHPFLADALKPTSQLGAPHTNLAPSNSPQRVTPSKEVVENAAAPVPTTWVGVAADQNMRLSSSSSEFYKLYSPMADRMAEAARQSTNGDQERGGREASDAQWPRTDASQLRQSVASAASMRYDGAEDDVASRASSHHKSDSDYNPVEEPSWVQQDSLVGTHFSYDHDASPADTPRIRAYAVEQSTAVESPVRERKARQKQAFASPVAVARMEESMEDINSFIKLKADRETMRLSMPFGPQISVQEPGIQEQGSRHQQWEDELMQELASHRNNRSQL